MLPVLASDRATLNLHGHPVKCVYGLAGPRLLRHAY